MMDSFSDNSHFPIMNGTNTTHNHCTFSDTSSSSPETPIIAPVAIHKRPIFTHNRRTNKSNTNGVPTIKTIPVNEKPLWSSKSPTRYSVDQNMCSGPPHSVEYSYQLEELCKNLLEEKILGIAFKTFADHSYQFICILQISTYDKDYIIDAINLRNQLFLLNDILSNPQICKVVYERNLVLSLMYNLLGLDLVNVFDINHVALRYKIKSNNTFDLGRILCDSTAEISRSLEGADWRFRPLPSEMRNYAQQETALLIPIYNELQKLEQIHGPPPPSPSTDAPNITELFTSASWNISNQTLCMQDGPNLESVLGFSEDLQVVRTVPDSMEEIYILSNANRKRNKEKKKMKGDSAKLDSQSAMDANDLEAKRKSLENPEDFMRKIGWLGEERKSFTLSPEIKTSHRRTKSGDGSERTKHKRRGKRHRKQSSCTFPPKNGFPFDETNKANNPFQRKSPQKLGRN